MKILREVRIARSGALAGWVKLDAELPENINRIIYPTDEDRKFNSIEIPIRRYRSPFGATTRCFRVNTHQLEFLRKLEEFIDIRVELKVRRQKCERGGSRRGNDANV